MIDSISASSGTRALYAQSLDGASQKFVYVCTVDSEAWDSAAVGLDDDAYLVNTR